jgi:hypothetical protein
MCNFLPLSSQNTYISLYPVDFSYPSVSCHNYPGNLSYPDYLIYPDYLSYPGLIPKSYRSAANYSWVDPFYNI